MFRRRGFLLLLATCLVIHEGVTKDAQPLSEICACNDTRLAILESRLDLLEQNAAETNSRVAVNEDFIKNNITLDLDNLKDQSTIPMVVFRADTPHDYSLETNQIVIYTRVIVNEGAAYDKFTGIFTAPYDGVYLLTAKFCTNTGKYMYYAIVVDNVKQDMGYTYDGDGLSCHSVTSVVVMKTGMRAWVMCTSGSSTLIRSGSYYWNTFTGALIHK